VTDAAQPLPLRLMIVEDNPDDLSVYLRHLLTWPGQDVTVQTYELGEPALAALQASAPDCLLLDYLLPDLTGLEVLAEVRGTCPVVMLTGLGDERVAVNAMKGGAQDYLVKDRLGAPELRHAVEQAVERYRLEQEVARASRRTAALQGLLVRLNAATRLMDVMEVCVQCAETLGADHARVTVPGQPDVSHGNPAPGGQMQQLPLGEDALLHLHFPDLHGVPDDALTETFAGVCAQALGRATAHEQERDLRESLERRVLERTEDLRRSNRDLEQFAYVASHDLKEPLRTISSYTQLIDQRYGPMLDARGQTYLAQVTEGAGRLYRLIEDLLGFARIGQEEPVQAACDLDRLLATVLQDLQVSLREANATVTHSALPTVQADAALMTQLFLNLLGNALKFRRPGVPPVIHVTAERTGDTWTLRVSDNGLGMDPQYSDQIFALFQRLHSRKAYPGNGIGLSVCRRIVERLGGSIWVESTPGEGSTFLFTLPALDARRAAHA